MIMRTLLSGRWLLRSAIALVAIVLCLLAAAWQWDRSQQQLTAEQAALAEPAPVGEVVSPSDPVVPIEALGRQVTLDGKYIAGAQTVIRSRLSQDREAGFWVVNGIRTPDGTVVAALRGWSATDQPQAPTGSVAITGRLQPDENFYPDSPITEKQPLVTITQAGLRKQWEPPITAAGGDTLITPGFVAVTDMSPGDTGLGALVPLIGIDPEIDFPLRNVFYSLQWLVFVGFVIVIWVKWLRDDLAEARRDDEEDAPGEAETDRVSLQP